MFMVAMKTPYGDNGMPIPSEGIYDMNGHLFHHSSARYMRPEGAQRLREHGIYYEPGKRYTKEENALIEKNCEEFRAEHNLSPMDLLKCVGFGGARGNHFGELFEFRRRTNMWPRLCRGLESRCAKNVRQRVVRIYHALALPDRPFTEEDDRQLQHLLKRYPMVAICELMSRSYGSLWARQMFMEYHQKFAHTERRKLWNIMYVLAPQCHTAQTDWSIPEPNKEVWEEVWRAMGRFKKTIAKEWAEMVAELERLREAGSSFSEALDSVAPESCSISAADFSEFIEVLLEEAPDLNGLRLNKRQKKDAVDKMKKYGITGFRTGRHSDFVYCIRRLGRLLCALRRRLLRPASLRLSLSTQLRLLSRCLRSLPGAEKNKGFVLRRSHVITQIEKQLVSENPEWKLSRKLRRYIEGEKD